MPGLHAVMRKSLYFLLALLLAACTTIGTKFDVDKVDQLQPGISTVDDAIQLLGPVKAESVMGGETKLLQWQFVQGSLAGGSGAHVAILFDRNGKMIRVTHKSKT